MKITKKAFIFLSLLVATGLSSRVNTAYNGLTGLLETPNARIMEDLSIRLFASDDKYRNYQGFSFTPLSSLELNFNKKSLEGVKSKEINAKFLLKREDKIWPSILLGVNNIKGSSSYDSKYLAISKRYKYLDFTIGLEKKKLFGGVELFINPKYTFLAEYTKNSKLNSGIRYNWSDTTSFTASLHDRDIFTLGFNYQFGLSSTKNPTTSNISYQSIEKDDALWCEIEGRDDALDISIASKALKKAVKTTPTKYKTLYATIKHHDIPYKTIKVNTKEFEVFLKHNVSNNYMRKAIQIDRKTNIVFDRTDDIKKFNYYISPTIRTILNDKENPFATKASVELGFSYDFQRGIFLNANFSQPFYNDIKDINSSKKEKLSYLDYYKYNGTQMNRLTLDIVKKTSKNSFVKAEVGYLDVAYAGVDLEWFKPMYEDRFGLGVEYQRVYKRYVEKMSKVYKDKKYDGKFLNIYYLLSKEKNLHLSAKVGEFLAGERGGRIDIVRSYNRFSIGGYYYTSQDRKYSDEGIYFKLPLNSLISKDIKGNLDYTITPEPKRVGQFATTSYSLSSMLNSENNIQIMKEEIGLFGD